MTINLQKVKHYASDLHWIHQKMQQHTPRVSAFSVSIFILTTGSQTQHCKIFHVSVAGTSWNTDKFMLWITLLGAIQYIRRCGQDTTGGQLFGMHNYWHVKPCHSLHIMHYLDIITIKTIHMCEAFNILSCASSSFEGKTALELVLLNEYCFNQNIQGVTIKNDTEGLSLIFL